MRLIGLDTETTGFDASTGDRIVEIALRTYDMATRELVDSYIQRIDPDRNIPASAQAVHGISYDMLVGQPKWEDVAPEVKRRLDDAQIMVAHNMGFDGPFIGFELLRVGLALPTAEPFCTMENARWACPDGKYPSLAELCFALGVPFDIAKAHGAEYDTDKMVECFWRGLDRGVYAPALLLCVQAGRRG